MAAARRAVAVTMVTTRKMTTPAARAQGSAGVRAAIEAVASTAGSVDT
jgi:hypothetical protein